MAAKLSPASLLTNTLHASVEGACRSLHASKQIDLRQGFMGKDLDLMNVHGHVDGECVGHRPYRGWVTKLASEEPVAARVVRVVKRAIGLIGDLKNLRT